VETLPLALLRLRESEIVRLCGLMRAAHGQEAARQSKVTQAERKAGTLRATILDGDISRVVAAHFSDGGLTGWECACPVGATHQAASNIAAASAAQPQQPAHSFACEHVAALLWAWLRDPRQFQTEESRSVALPAPAGEDTGGTPPAPAALESLDSVARQLLGLLALAGGSATDEEALRLFARMGLGSGEEAPPMLRLLYEAGWLARFRRGSQGRSLHAALQQGWQIPAARLSQVPREVPLEEVPAEAVEAELSTHLADGRRLAEQFLLVLAQVVADQTSAHQTMADLPRQLQAQFSLSGEQARFSLAMLYQAGLLSSEQVALASRAPGAAPQERASLSVGGANVGASGETLLRGARLLLWRDTQEVLRDLLMLWLHARPARELADLRDAGVRVATLGKRERQVASEIAAENQAAKAFVLEMLRAVPVGQWWSFGSWVEFVWRFRPAFLRGRQQGLLRPQWWLERPEDGRALALEVRGEWRQGEGRYLALLFRHALHWLGLLDLAFDARGRLQAFRLTEQGALLLAEVPLDSKLAPTPAPTSQDEQKLLLQPIKDDCLLVPLAALRAAQASALETLLHWCEPAGATAAGLLVRPSARRVAASLDAKHDLDAWLATLEAVSPATSVQPALKALVERVRGWAAAYGRVRLYSGVALLEVAEAGLMRELERVAHLDKRRDHALSPEMALIRPADVEPLLEELWRRGYAPWMRHDEDAH
jgi:hypothetical protein